MRSPFRRSSIVVLVALALALAHASALAQERAGRLVAVIGIPSEIAPVEARLEAPVTTRIQGFVFTVGTVEGARIVVARSGVGKVNAAIVATLLLDHYSPAAVLFTGTAGAVDKNLNPADVVIGTAVGYHDFGSITDRGFNRSPTRDPVSGQVDPPFFPADPALLGAAQRAAKTVQPSRGPRTDGDAPGIREGVIVTGDAFVSAADRRNDLRSDLNAAAVEMEGAAVAQVCFRYRVPFIVIRAITDRADSQAQGSYQRFLDTASRNAADLTLATIREFLKQP
ncbi:MAG TPA: 5'-methylthioadenosine/adenosylhomocysteine nucleosidase [Terriglobia bacterium]|nr:5'-methylthioadenosine/adenosylhomocysteine nucleosidase [Terriglobia bacterium]